MKALIFSVLLVLSPVAFAEHDAVYCGKILDGSLGRDTFFNDHPEAILAVEYRVTRGFAEFWSTGYGALWSLDAEETAFVRKAVQSSLQNETLFCVSARWGGSVQGSSDIENISLSTDNVSRIDYMSRFAKNRP